MSVNESFHPLELLDELDAIAREQELLRLRTTALQARYRALEPYADLFNKPGPDDKPWSCKEYGSVNVKYTVQHLGRAAHDMADTVKYWLHSAHELAEKVREYPQPELEQADRPRVDRGRSR
ncbi:hypothetical protein ACIHDR_19550 [Nocardia sp. NPDC052278]|uniref:hypothetical protein n=1 Tax=unclassified Nocardia TaxID=2637762 RepID=UPI00368135E4